MAAKPLCSVEHRDTTYGQSCSRVQGDLYSWHHRRQEEGEEEGEEGVVEECDAILHVNGQRAVYGWPT